MAIRNIGSASSFNPDNNENRNNYSDLHESSVYKNSAKNLSYKTTINNEQKSPAFERVGSALAQAKVRQESIGNYNGDNSPVRLQSYSQQIQQKSVQQDNYTTVISNTASQKPQTSSATNPQKGVSASQKISVNTTKPNEEDADKNTELVSGIVVSAITGTFNMGNNLSRTKFYKSEPTKDNQQNSSSPQPVSPANKNDKQLKRTKTRTAVDITKRLTLENRYLLAGGSTLLYGWNPDGDTIQGINEVKLMTGLPLSSLAHINSKTFVNYRGEKITNKIIKDNNLLRNTHLITNGQSYTGIQDADIIKRQFEKYSPDNLKYYTKVNFNSYHSTRKYVKTLNEISLKSGILNGVNTTMENALKNLSLNNNSNTKQFNELSNLYSTSLKNAFNDDSNKQFIEKLKVLYTNNLITKNQYKDIKETYNIIKTLNNGKGLDSLSDTDLEKLFRNPNITGEQAAIVNEIYNLKNIKEIQSTALLEKMKTHGVSTKLNKIDLNNAQSIQLVLNAYSNKFLKSGSEDYTKMTISSLKSKLKKSEYKKDEDIIKTIINLKKQQQVVNKPKISARNIGMKAYMLTNKIMGSSDVMQGAKQAMQIATMTKAALSVANAARKVTGKALLSTSKFLYKKAGIQKLVQKTEKGRKIENLAKDTKAKVDKAKALKNEKVTNFQTKKINLKNSIKDKIKNTKAVKAVSSAIGKIPGSKFAGNAIKKMSSFLGAFADILKKIKLYVIIVVASAFLLVALVNGLMAVVENNALISTLITIQGNEDTGEIEKATDKSTSLFAEVYNNLINADNKWFDEKESIKSEKKTSSVVGDPHFKLDDGVATSTVILDKTSLQGYWNPDEKEVFEISTFGNDDPSLQGGVYIYYNNGDESSVNKHSNVKMCMALSHGLIMGDYEHFSEHFAEFCYGLWDNSRDYTYKLVTKDTSSLNANRYLYSCNVCNETFKYSCINDTSISNSSVNANAGVPAGKKIAVIDADKNKENGLYDATTLITTDKGCIKVTHENNGSKKYTETDLNSNVTSKNSSSNETLNAYEYFSKIKSSPTATTQEKALAEEALNSIYLEKFGYTDAFSAVDYEGSNIYMEEFLDNISINPDCNDYTIVKTGTKTIKCSDYNYMLGFPIVGCTELLNGKHANNDKNCISSNTISENHGTRRLWAPDGCSSFATYYIYEDKEIAPGVSISIPILYYECKGHTTKICDGNCPNGYTCYGHSVPTYKAVCNDHYCCDGHTATLCTGHMDLDIAASIIGLDEDDNLYATDAWTTDGKINDGSWFFKPEYRPFATIVDEIYNNHDESGQSIVIDKDNNPVPDYNYYYKEDGSKHLIWDGTKLHWTNDMKEYVNALLATNWEEVYGVGASTEKLNTNITMSSSEIIKVIDEFYPIDINLYAEKVDDGYGGLTNSTYKLEYDARYKILTRALYGITRIPFYPGGRASSYELEDNSFGSLLRDESGIIKEGIYTAPDGTECTFSYKGLDWNGFILWTTSTGDPINTNINSLIKSGTKIPFVNAKPGDIYVAGEEKGIYLGKKLDETTGTEKAYLIRFNVPSKTDTSINLSLSSEDIASVSFYTFYKTY